MVFPTLAKSKDNIACHSEERNPPRHPEERSDAGIYLCEDAECNGRLPRAEALAMTKQEKQRHSVSFRAQSRNPLEADQGNSVYNAPTARRSFVTLRMTAKRKTRETKTKTNN